MCVRLRRMSERHGSTVVWATSSMLVARPSWHPSSGQRPAPRESAFACLGQSTDHARAGRTPVVRRG